MSEELGNTEAAPTTEVDNQEASAESTPDAQATQEATQEAAPDDRLARLERKLWDQQKQNKEAQEKLSKFSELEQLATKDPVGAMRHLNIDVVQALDSILGAEEKESEPEDVHTLKAKFEQELKVRDEQWQQKLEASLNERETKARQQKYISNQGRAITDFITGNAAKHPVSAKLIKSKHVTPDQLFDAMSLEYSRRVKHSEIHGGEAKIPSPEEVAGILEKEYVQQIKTLQEFLSGINLNLGESLSDSPSTPRAQPAQSPSPTLTNRLSTESSKLSVEPKSYEDSRARALEILRLGLNNE